MPWHPYVRHLLRLFTAVRRVVVRVRERDRHLRRLVGVCVRRGSCFFLFLLLLRLGRGGQRPDAFVVVVRREDLLPLRAVTRDARVQLNLVRHQLTAWPRAVAPVVLPYRTLDPLRFARSHDEAEALDPLANLEPGRLKPDTLVVRARYAHLLDDARDLLKSRVVRETQVIEGQKVANLGGKRGDVVVR